LDRIDDISGELTAGHRLLRQLRIAHDSLLSLYMENKMSLTVESTNNVSFPPTSSDSIAYSANRTAAELAKANPVPATISGALYEIEKYASEASFLSETDKAHIDAVRTQVDAFLASKGRTFAMVKVANARAAIGRFNTTPAPFETLEIASALKDLRAILGTANPVPAHVSGKAYEIVATMSQKFGPLSAAEQKTIASAVEALNGFLTAKGSLHAMVKVRQAREALEGVAASKSHAVIIPTSTFNPSVQQPLAGAFQS